MKRFWLKVTLFYLIVFLLTILVINQAYAQNVSLVNTTQIITVSEIVISEHTVTEFVKGVPRDQLSLFGYSMPVVSDLMIAGIIVGLSVIIFVLAIEVRYHRSLEVT